MANTQSRDARDYSVIRDIIAQDFYRAAGVREKDVVPLLSREQIVELNRYADTLPFFGTDRRQFKENIRMAEQTLELSEAVATRRMEQERSSDEGRYMRGDSQSQVTKNTDRSDRDGYSRGR